MGLWNDRGSLRTAGIRSGNHCQTILELNTAISELAAENGVPLVWVNVGPRGMLEPEEYPATSYVDYEHYERGSNRLRPFFDVTDIGTLPRQRTKEASKQASPIEYRSELVE